MLSVSLRLLAAFVSGAALALAFAPTAYWWLGILSLATLFWLQMSLKPRVAWAVGFLFGLGLYLVGVSWVYVSLTAYGGMPWWMGGIAVLGFTSLMALFVAFPCALAAWIAQRVDRRACTQLNVLCLAWLVFEWSKSWVLSGFPWLDLGYSQTPSWLFALAPIGGVYLVSAAVLISAALLVWMARHPQARSLIVITIALGLIWLGSAAMSSYPWVQAVGDPVTVGVVQPNTAIESKWLPDQRQVSLQKLRRLSHKLVADSNPAPELIVWPETALALYLHQTDAQFWQDIRPPNTALLSGLIESPDLEHSYNAAVLICQQQAAQVYRKRHLVPFGEFLPLRFLFNWVLEYLDLPMSDFSAWRGEQPLSCGEHFRIGLSICYEDAFAGEQRTVNAGSNILVNISEDAWFGDSFAPHQRLQMGQMRARELARPMLRSANSGPSALIDETGRVLIQTRQFETVSFVQTIQGVQGQTPYQRFGNWIVWLSLAGLSLWLLRALFRHG